jgi:hypothetical protein
MLETQTFATPERQLVFDLNDFGEVACGPWVFLRACRSGKLEARSDEDMAADFRV